MIFGHTDSNGTSTGDTSQSADASMHFGNTSTAPQMTTDTELLTASENTEPPSVLDQPSEGTAAVPPTADSTALSSDDTPVATHPVSNDTPVAEPAQDTPVVVPNDSTALLPADDHGHSNTKAQEDLLELKQKALNELAPLVSHLDQTPEEKFRTTMMMLQSTDNQALINQAYEAAQAIPDEKVRAQALLDVVNEINYFTQKDGGHSEAA